MGDLEQGTNNQDATITSLGGRNATAPINPAPETELHCGHGDLLGPLGLFVQGMLAMIAFGSLIVKRFCEPRFERRTWKVWFFDTSKQAIGAGIIHFGNVFLADVFQGDPCTWYFVSFLLDSTLGLVIIYVGLKISQIIAHKMKWQNLILGDYGSPPQCRAWVLQCCLYVVVMVIEKLLMTLLVLFDFWKKVRELILAPIKSPSLEIVLVMFIVPFVVNAIIFWVVDNFLKKKAFKQPHISTTENSMKYFRAVDKVKYYNNAQRADDSESDALLSLDDEPEDGSAPRYRGNAGGVANGAVGGACDDDSQLIGSDLDGHDSHVVVTSGRRETSAPDQNCVMLHAMV